LTCCTSPNGLKSPRSASSVVLKVRFPTKRFFIHSPQESIFPRVAELMSPGLHPSPEEKCPCDQSVAWRRRTQPPTKKCWSQHPIVSSYIISHFQQLRDMRASYSRGWPPFMTSSIATSAMCASENSSQSSVLSFQLRARRAFLLTTDNWEPRTFS
jgi:hypothetical protein